MSQSAWHSNPARNNGRHGGAAGGGGGPERASMLLCENSPETSLSSSAASFSTSPNMNARKSPSSLRRSLYNVVRSNSTNAEYNPADATFGPNEGCERSLPDADPTGAGGAAAENIDSSSFGPHSGQPSELSTTSKGVIRPHEWQICSRHARPVSFRNSLYCAAIDRRNSANSTSLM